MTIPFFSIVIATYNCANFLEAAIKSVLNQSCQDFELIIVDGGSKDSSVDILQKSQDRIAWWVSEPDAGQSDAFNKGYSHASGRFYTWLNADDILLPDTLQKVKSKLEANPWASWATGNFFRFTESDKRIIEAQWGPHFLPSFLQTPNSPLAIFGPTTFWSCDIYKEIGGLDENLHYAMDTDYWIRIMKAGHKQVRVNHFCWAFRMHENSKTAEFGDHKSSPEVQVKKRAEAVYIFQKSSYKVSKVRRIVGIFMRFVDLSVMRAFYNKLFVVGKTFNG